MRRWGASFRTRETTRDVVSSLTPGSATPTQLGSIQLADFINPGGLQAVGQNLFDETASSGSPSTGTPGLNGLGTVIQGALETSNVNVVEELVNMIDGVDAVLSMACGCGVQERGVFQQMFIRLITLANP